MNIVFGSNGSLGNELVNTFLRNEKKVIGFDIQNGVNNQTIVIPSLTKSIQEIEKHFKYEIESISFCQGLTENGSKEDIFFSNYQMSRQILEKYLYSFSKKVSICFISSVHAIQSNEKNLDYAFSKSVLESYFKNLCLDEEFSQCSKTLIRLGAMESEMLKSNVKNFDEMITYLPSKSIISPIDLSKFIYDYHTNYKEMLNCSILNIENGISFKLSGE